jgi:uncharacterized SAM-binding protein YcdF (DUF218 family)
MGVDSGRIVAVSSPIPGTHNEALTLKTTVRQDNIRSIILVTQKGHALRSYLTFKRTLADVPVDVSVAAGEVDWYHADNWWKNHDGLSYLAREYIALLYYWYHGFV